MTVLGIVPLRISSKRILIKNFQLLNGKHLYQYAVENLAEIGGIEKLVIIADKIALRMVRLYGYPDKFTLIEEPEELARGDVMIEPVLAYAIKKVGGADIALLRHATSPLIPSEYIKQCVKAVKKPYNSAFLVCEDRHQHWEYLQDTWIPCFDKRVLSQYRVPKYIETGGAYAFNVEPFLQKMSVTVGPTKGIPIPEEYAIDIDEWHDLWMVEALMRKEIRGGENA